jgi:ankyrin repeat protein
LSKNKYEQTAWHEAAAKSRVEILQKLCDWAKELQLKSEELRNELSKNIFGQTPYHQAAQRGRVVFEKLWDWAINLQLKL